MTTAANGFTLGSYLVHRLEEAGVGHVFGVPGDYVLDFLDLVTQSSLKWVGTCNELNAGYAADGYARLHGLGAAVVTYGVGGFSILNAVAGAYAEQVPLVVVSGAPPTLRRQTGAMMHHLASDYLQQFDIFRKVTVDGAMLLNPQTAPDEIDRVLASCLAQKRPVYLELPMDLAQAPCRAPQPLAVRRPPASIPEALAECVAEAARRLNAAQHPVVLAGVELPRFGLAETAQRLIEKVELPYATTVGSKSALPELHPQFIGLYQGALSRPAVRQEVESADCVLALGVWMTDFDTGGFSVKLAPGQLISANSDSVRIGFHTYPGVRLADFIAALEPVLTPRAFAASHPAHPMRMKDCFVAQPAAALTVRRFFTRLDSFLDDSMILLVEPGDAVCAAPDLYIEEPENFIAQAYYLSIGYCTPAALGVSLARPGKRAVVLTGDGAFQMTAQEVSTLLRQECPAIFFVINNRGYMIERKLHADGPYNDIADWQYHRLPEVFGAGAVTRRVTTEGELEEAMAVALTERHRLVFIELCFPEGDCSAALGALGEKFHAMSAAKAAP